MDYDDEREQLGGGWRRAFGVFLLIAGCTMLVVQVTQAFPWQLGVVLGVAAAVAGGILATDPPTRPRRGRLRPPVDDSPSTSTWGRR